MKSRLLDLIVCPDCGGRFDVAAEDTDRRGWRARARRASSWSTPSHQTTPAD